MSNNKTTNERNGLKSFWTVGAIVTVATIVVIFIWFKVVRGGEDALSGIPTFVAKRGPLTISVLESGTITPQEQITLRDEVEGKSSIVSLVPDGSRVKKGDLLVELDASTINDHIIDQDIAVQRADAAYVGAKETLAVTENQAKSDIDKAKLTLKFARQDLDQYVKGKYPKDVNEQTAKIRLAEENLKRAEDVNDWSKRLFQEKYLSETEYLADRLSVQRNKLDRDVAKSDLDLLQNFTYQRQIEQLTSDVNQAEMALERTQRKASADVLQANADFKAKELEYNRQKDKMKKYQDQLSKTKIFAPQDGMVVYATSAGGGRHGPFDRRDPMDIGVDVSERQDLISLPTADSMKAQVDVHETSLEKVHVGLPAIITVDALVGKKFLGRVERIAPLPDARMQWANPDLKIYPTDINLEESDSMLRAGMSCKAEIIIAQYKDTVYIPVQAVLRIAGQPTVYVVNNDGSYTERKVETGLDDNNMIRIISGLDEGEVVLLTPPLKAATIESGSKISGIELHSGAGSLQERVNQTLEDANNKAASPSQQGPGQSINPPDESSKQQGSVEAPSSDQMNQMRQRFQNMSPEERQKAMEQMRQRFENMSPEEKDAMRQRLQRSGGSRQGRGQRQGAGGQGQGTGGQGQGTGGQGQATGGQGQGTGGQRQQNDSQSSPGTERNQ
jgi:HlyD family secretion protein